MTEESWGEYVSLNFLVTQSLFWLMIARTKLIIFRLIII